MDFVLARLFEQLPWVQHGFGTRQCSAIEPGLATVKQIHSNLVLSADAPGLCGEGDALVTNCPGISVSVRTADCYPILLVDARQRAVAAVHAGWRGTVTHIVDRTLEKMHAEFGTAPADVYAAIGPGIGVCCYEVGEEVASQFGFAARTHLDLALENRKQLETAGVAPQNIEALGVCTFCDAKRLFSYRREKEKAGRMTSYIRLTSEIKPR
jgi:purine-nucleoside/S-methyl-5'-thioadenosine phosphorylase / adenosine deaminase